MTQDQERNKKRNIILMIFLIIALLIGIVVRWPYIRKEASSSFDRYLHPENATQADSIQSSTDTLQNENK